MAKIAYRVSPSCCVACLGIDESGLIEVRKKIEAHGYEEISLEEFDIWVASPAPFVELDESEEEEEPIPTRSRTTSNAKKKALSRKKKKSGKPRKGLGRKSKGYRNKR